ncbi:amino acid/amide ABC transporter membrane protein 1 (HAAT family) [Fluviicoccus keumensis]|uniref:Amino acid/amide ABC transporter membrane protein 1 (HAAT family) n=1 Tax=Fluviicoccus keumensis TaxID=1435465 RepID=A0A4Q7YLH9_9GAMM|nr:urea ABC transporter permease subunit UrtB [Fluviicoccus keumensis]RZU38190.1 amino acid/amide ABC transporter membrane protein 1 (HAAT family) [Fluviicoccus keumensis]
MRKPHSPSGRTPLLRALALLALFQLTAPAWAEDPPAADGSLTGAETVVAEAAAPLPATFEGLLLALPDADFDVRAEIIRRLPAIAHPRLLPVLEALVEGQLNVTMDEPRKIVIVAAEGDDPVASDALTGKALGPSSALSLDMIPVNNALRGALRDLIAGLQLASPDKANRLAAAQRLIASDEISPEQLTLVQAQLGKEQDSAVKDLLTSVAAVAALGSESADARRAAIHALENSLYPEVRAKLQNLAENDADDGVKNTAKATLVAIDEKLALNHAAENVFFGLSLGSVLLLSAIGLAITFGVMGVINMAHGELMMLGAYTTYVIQQLMPNHIGAGLLLSIPAAFLVSGLVGIAIERGIIRHLYGRPLETLLATFGISLILQQAVRSVFSPLNRQVASPEWMSGSLVINPALAITYNRLFIVGFALLVFFILLVAIKRTTLGLKLRAVAQNRAMARAVGVRADRVDALTFGLGSGIAGVAGVALSQLTNVGPNLGQAYIIDSFMVVVFGGVGNLWGTLVAAFSLGVANKFLEPFAGAVLAKILILGFIILFIQKRPRGLFPQKGRAAEA